MRFSRPGDRRGSGHHVVVHPGNTRRGRRYGNIHIEIGGVQVDRCCPRVNDPITLDIIQNSLQAIADEMFAAMRRRR